MNRSSRASLSSPNSLVRIPRSLRVLARRAAWVLLLAGVALLFVPWQQSATGAGRVIAYSPVEREQLIEAPVEGRVVGWYVEEGTRVSAGDRLADISDNDPEILARLGRERDAVISRMEAAQSQMLAYERQIEALESSRVLALEAADARIRMAENTVKAAENGVKAAEALYKASKLHYDRQSTLEREGLSSRRTYELARAGWAKDKTDIYRAKADLEGAHADVLNQRASREKTNADAFANIESTRSSMAKARSDIAKAEEELAKVEVRLSRQASMAVHAPRDGVIVRVLVREGGEFIKAGEALAVLVPDTASRAVELWVTGNDASLISAGRHVRIQFEGWPAIQFTGWPAVAVGTFGGTVAFVDASASRTGRFRVVVVPDGEPWPAPRYLRQGVRANGWVLLNEVTLGYELWRQLNGFPPVVSVTEPVDAVQGRGKSERDARDRLKETE